MGHTYPNILLLARSLVLHNQPLLAALQVGAAPPWSRPATLHQPEVVQEHMLNTASTVGRNAMPGLLT